MSNPQQLKERKAWNNRRRRHLDKLARCERCEDQELPCPRPEVRITQVGDDEFLVATRLFHVPTHRSPTGWHLLGDIDGPVTVPAEMLPRFKDWSLSWDEKHKLPS